MDETNSNKEGQDMRKLHLLGLALVAAFAFAASTTASTMAAPPATLLAEWLWNGSAVLSELLVDIEGELLLEDIKLGIDVLCSGSGEGTITANGEGLATKLLSLSGEEIGEGLTGLALECVNDKGCENPLLWPDGLPWPMLLELIELDTVPAEWSFAVLTAALAGWDIECMSIIPTSELCEAPNSVVSVTNEATNVDVETTDAFTELAGLKLGSCTVGGNETAILEGLGILLDPEGGNLQVSSEP
jgi:hypothetical protein